MVTHEMCMLVEVRRPRKDDHFVGATIIKWIACDNRLYLEFCPTHLGRAAAKSDESIDAWHILLDVQVGQQDISMRGPHIDYDVHIHLRDIGTQAGVLKYLGRGIYANVYNCVLFAFFRGDAMNSSVSGVNVETLACRPLETHRQFLILED